MGSCIHKEKTNHELHYDDVSTENINKKKIVIIFEESESLIQRICHSSLRPETTTIKKYQCMVECGLKSPIIERL